VRPLPDEPARRRAEKATMALRIKPRRSTRRVRVSVAVADAVGNKGSTARTVTLPR